MSKRKTHDDLIKWIFNAKIHSIWIAVLGQNQTGKTDLALFIAERLQALGLAHAFASNIPNLEAPFKIEFIEDFETLKKFCQMINPNPNVHGLKRIIFIADEIGNWAPQDQPWLNTDLIREMQGVRKYGLCAITTGIARIDQRILNEKHFHGYFMKHSKSDPTRATYVNWFRGGKRAEVYNIPRTTIGFDTFYSAMFYMKPRATEGMVIPLNAEHEKVFRYLDHGCSWKKAGIETKEGKRAMIAVAKWHRENCLHSIQEPAKESSTSEPSTQIES